MITVERTRDMDLVKSILGHASIYKGDMAVKEWSPYDYDDHYFILAKLDNTPIGIVGYKRINEFTYEPHVGFLPEYRGKYSVEAGEASLRYMKENYNAKLFSAFIDKTNKAAHKYTLKCGFKLSGENKKYNYYTKVV